MSERELRKLQLFNAHVKERLLRIHAHLNDAKPIRAETERLEEENTRMLERLRQFVGRGGRSGEGSDGREK